MPSIDQGVCLVDNFGHFQDVAMRTMNQHIFSSQAKHGGQPI